MVANQSFPMSTQVSLPNGLLQLHDSKYVRNFQTYFGLKVIPGDTQDGHHHQNGSSSKKPKNYQIGSYFWFYLFSFGSKLGYEFFYAFSYSYCNWNMDPLVCRQMICVWSLVMYIGQALKDIIQWPRPKKVIVLEPAYSLEYGMPSTHALLSLSVPLALFSILSSRYEVIKT